MFGPRSNQEDNSPFNHHPLANSKFQRLPTVIARIKLFPIALQGAAVVNLDAVAALGLTRAFVRVCVLGCDFCGEGEGEEGYEEE